MSDQLPLEIEPFVLARVGAKFSGHRAIHQFSRFKAVLNRDSGDVKVVLEVGKTASGLVYIRGSLITEIELICQRCSEPFLYDINVDFKLSPVLVDSQAVNVPQDYEPWVTHNRPVSVTELIEEELLLGLPMIAKHSPEECPIDVSRVLM